MGECKPVTSLMLKESIQSKKVDVNYEKMNFHYKKAVFVLMYLVTRKRPDIAYAVQQKPVKKLKKPCQCDVMLAKRILRYLRVIIFWNSIQPKFQEWSY